MSWTPPPGTIGLTHLYGSAAVRAAIGSRLLTDPSTYTHAFVVLDDGLIAEPWPSGARLRTLDVFDGEDVAYGWLPGLRPDQQRAVVAAARNLLGVGYGLLDYLALAVHRKGVSRRPVLGRVYSTERLLPGQFVVQTYRNAGIHLMPGRACQDITLDNLGELFLAAGWELRVPCTLYV